MDNGHRIIVDLDNLDLTTAKELVDQLAKHVQVFRIGLALGQWWAHQLMEHIYSHNCRILYATNFYDVASTVSAAAYELTRQGVSMFTVACQAGPAVLTAAVAAAQSAYKDTSNGNHRPMVLGVTVLPDMDPDGLLDTNACRHLDVDTNYQSDELDGNEFIQHHVAVLTKTARCCMLYGVITPLVGIEEARSASGDDLVIIADMRVKTFRFSPADAIRSGADCVIVGEEITNPANGTSVETLLALIAEIDAAVET